MWQILLGVYLIVSVPCFILLWACLVLAKKADQKTANDLRTMTD